mgnify:FL=1
MLYINRDCFDTDGYMNSSVEGELYDTSVDYLSTFNCLSDFTAEDLLCGFIEDEIYFEDDYMNYDDFKHYWLPEFCAIFNYLLNEQLH